MLKRCRSPILLGCLVLLAGLIDSAEGLRHSIHSSHEMRMAANMHTQQSHQDQGHNHKKHGAFGMDFSTKMLRKYSHELWQGVWWGIAANLALLAIVAGVIWLKQSIAAAKAHRRELHHSAAVKSHPEPVVAPFATSTAFGKSAGSTRSAHEPADRGASAAGAAHKHAAAASVHPAARVADYPPSHAATHSSANHGAASKPVYKAAAPAAAAPGAAGFYTAYKGAGRSLYSTTEE